MSTCLNMAHPSDYFDQLLEDDTDDNMVMDEPYFDININELL